MTSTEIAEHEERIRKLKEHQGKVRSRVVEPLKSESDFIGMPMNERTMRMYSNCIGKR